MKKIFLLLTLPICTLLLFACQSQKEEMTLLDDISSISISESGGYGGMNENYSMTIDEDVHISKFEEVLKNAKSKKQKVNVVNEKPDYEMLIRYESGETQGLHLILGNIGEKSRIMYIGHENNGFDISPRDTKILRAILDNQ